MPRDLTHVILADDIRGCLPAETRQCAETCESAFHMGAISHDSFLYGSNPKLSTKMHGGFGDDTRSVVLEMLDDIRKEKIAGYFFDLSKLSFAGMVIGSMTPMFTNIDNGVNWYSTILGVITSYVFAFFANRILK